MKDDYTADIEATFPALAIAYIETGIVQQPQKCLRKHTSSKIERLAAFISKSRVSLPLLLDRNNRLILGNARLLALIHLGFRKVPVIYVDHLDEVMIRAIIIADNQFCLNAGWDKKLLNQELVELEPLLKKNFGLELIDLGFEPAEIDLRIGDVALKDDADHEDGPKGSAVTHDGWIWRLGDHRLICGDSRQGSVYDALMTGELAQLVLTDPPFNVPVAHHVCGLGEIQHREFAMASGEMSAEEFIAFLAHIFSLLRKYSADGSIHFQFMDWRHSHEILTAGMKAGYTYLNLCVWVKDNGGMGSLYRSRHEMVHVFKSGEAPHINNVKLGKYGRYRTNIWEYAGINSFRAGRLDELAMHPTVKPVDLLPDAIKDCSQRGGIVLDCFGGSGSTLIAAEQTGRAARLIEIDALYCDVIVRRWQKLTGKQAALQSSGETFDRLANAMEGKNGQ